MKPPETFAIRLEDLYDAWLRGDGLPFWFDDGDVVAHTRRRITLTPDPAFTPLPTLEIHMAPIPVHLEDFEPLWDFSRPDRTEARFRALLPAYEAHASAARTLELRTQIARTLGLQQKFDLGHAELDQVDAARSAEPRVQVRSLLERGRLRNSNKEGALARPLFERAFEAARAAGEDTLAVDAAHMVAIVAPPADALVWNERALALAEASGNPLARKWRGSLLNNLGWTYHDKGDYPKALGLFEQAVLVRKEFGQATETRIAEWCVARTLRSLGRLDEALVIQERLRAENETAGQPDGFVWEELGELLWARGAAVEARPAFVQAYELLSKDPWLQRDEAPRLERLKRLAEGGP